ncbi:hypothetical protein [Pseudomonas sp. PAMC 25886]|jgi:hypothetical protein|uniref:hypothetical protein n=1 Tax=Pseudomonas sp. PAMC 25886 TaxID=1125977 RepID=UPI0002887328|nr:hypothetical protein [Pseudomonas sp. PAMC 25886]
MSSPLLGIGMDSNRSQFMARQRIESEINLPRIFAAIDADPGIVGAGVVYIDADFNIITLREFKPICSIQPKRIIVREAQRYIAPAQFADQVINNPREGRLIGEAINTTLSCGGAIIGWLVVLSGTIAVPFTAGASSVMTVIGYASATASTASCLVGAFRTRNEIVNPGMNDYLDNEEWYQYATKIMDGAALVGVGASTLTTVKLINVTRAATGKSLRQVLKGLNGHEREKLTKELLKIADPQMSTKMRKLLQLSGELPKRFPPTQLKHATIVQIGDAFSAGLGVWGLKRSDNYKQAKTFAIGLYEETE